MKDNYLKHELHTKNEKDCSTCWSKAFMLKQLTSKNYRQQEMRDEIMNGRITDNQISPNPIWD